MDRRRLRGILTQGVVAPLATVAVVAAVAFVAGVGVGLVVLGLSMVAAAGLAGTLLTDTRESRPDTETADGGVDARNPVGVRNELTDSPTVSSGNKRVLTRYTAGLFLVTVGLVLYLGGVFG